MAVATSRMSAAEYLATPEDRPRHTELINGVVVLNEPKLTHARPQKKILVALDLLGRLPDLVVEVHSPSMWARDLKVKLPAYESAGVAEAWFVDTEARTVLVFRRSTPVSATFAVAAELGAEGELTSPLLPGFAMLVGSIFER